MNINFYESSKHSVYYSISQYATVSQYINISVRIEHNRSVNYALKLSSRTIL